jgi:starch phosphorylase
MGLVEDVGHGDHLYRHEIVCSASGRYGFTTRVTPHGADWKPLMPGFITWANGTA